MKDYLDEVIEKDCEADPEFAKQWAKLKARKALSRLRREHHLTQATVAQRMGVPQSRVAEIEARPDRVSFIRMISYAKALGVSLEAVAEATTETV